MKRIRTLFFVLLGPCLVGGMMAANPVLKGVCDAGCIRYAGKYYLGGVATEGDFFVSDNLTDWQERVHVFDLDNQWTHGTGARNNQVHADDISYSGGQFHLLFSVNYWGDDRRIVHITHATSPSICGPYREVRDDQWFENRIDPQVFCDEDGKLYLYMVKFTEGNVIWGRPLNADFTFAGDAVQQFSAQPDTWETCDNRVAEGPFVIKYRGRYYMMYNANHTDPSYGNYHLGVCEASSPLAFNPGGKYSHPVVSPNTEAVAERYTDLLRYGGDGFNIIDLSEKEHRFTLKEVPDHDVFLFLAQWGGCAVRINGHAINPGTPGEFGYFRVKSDCLRVGENTLTTDGKAAHLFLYDTEGVEPDEAFVTPGQPNIVRGPNGWEWWLVYMANQGWGRHQFIDRIHFVEGRLTVDGITGPHTPGFHPAPAKPQYAGTSLDSIPVADSYLLELTFSSSDARQGVRIGNRTLLLPQDMATGVSHEWRIEKDHGLLTAWVDRILVADHLAVKAKAGRPRWVGQDKNRKVEYISFCEGFDEYASHFSGWQGASVTGEGLLLSDSVASIRTAPACDYAMSGCFSASSRQGQYGFYAAYWGERDFLRVSIDAQRGLLLTERVTPNGERRTTETPLAQNTVRYPDIKYSDMFHKQFSFPCDTYLQGISYPRMDAINETILSGCSRQEQEEDMTYTQDIASLMTLEYLDGDTWRPLSYTPAESDNNAWQSVRFPAVKTKEIRMRNKGPRDYAHHIHRIKADTQFQGDNQLRVERRADTLYIYVGEQLLQTVSLGTSAPARVGLYHSGQSPVLLRDLLYYVVR